MPYRIVFGKPNHEGSMITLTRKAMSAILKEMALTTLVNPHDIPSSEAAAAALLLGMPREGFWDPKACMAGMQKISMVRLGRSGICGMCIAACPFTQAHIKRSLT